MLHQPLKPAGSWLYDSFMSYHVVQFLLFIGRFFLFVNTWTARFAAWLVSKPSVGVNDAIKIFNVDCRV
jgi:L-gulonolactone oxidase